MHYAAISCHYSPFRYCIDYAIISPPAADTIIDDDAIDAIDSILPLLHLLMPLFAIIWDIISLLMFHMRMPLFSLTLLRLHVHWVDFDDTDDYWFHCAIALPLFSLHCAIDDTPTLLMMPPLRFRHDDSWLRRHFIDYFAIIIRSPFLRCLCRHYWCHWLPAPWLPPFSPLIRHYFAFIDAFQPAFMLRRHWLIRFTLIIEIAIALRCHFHWYYAR